MQTSLNKSSSFYDRLEVIMSDKGINSVNEFATKYLGYKSPQKINRLKKEGAKPSFDIILEVLNKFEELNPEWLLKGQGPRWSSNILDKNQQVGHANEPQANYKSIPEVITVDGTGRENILLVPVKAQAGYLQGYEDPAYLEQLPSYRLPNVNNGTFRMFEVKGDSMYPTLHSGAIAVGEYVEDLEDIKDNLIYIVVTKDDGVTIKRCLNRFQKYGTVYAKSDNRREYPSFPIKQEDIVEVWKLKTALLFNFQDPSSVHDRLNDLEVELSQIKGLLSK